MVESRTGNKAKRTNGSSGSSLGCGISSTSAYFPLPYLICLCVDHDPNDPFRNDESEPEPDPEPDADRGSLELFM